MREFSLFKMSLLREFKVFFLEWIFLLFLSFLYLTGSNFPQETFKYLLGIVKNFCHPFQLKGLKRGLNFTVDGIIDNFSRHDYDLILDCK